MADLRVRLLDLATRVATEFKTIRTEIATGLGLKQSTLVSGTNIKTVNGSSLLGSGDITIAAGGGDVTQAANSASAGKMKISAGANKQIVDYAGADGILKSVGGVPSPATAGTDYSAPGHTHTASNITDFNTAADARIANWVGAAPAAFDTLTEIAAYISSDQAADAGVATALGNRVRYDAAQTLSAGQKTQACANIGIGEPDTDFVATFNTGLL